MSSAWEQLRQAPRELYFLSFLIFCESYSYIATALILTPYLSANLGLSGS